MSLKIMLNSKSTHCCPYNCALANFSNKLSWNVFLDKHNGGGIEVMWSSTFSFLLLAIVKDSKFKKLCLLVKNIMMNKMCKNNTLLLATELIFCNNPKVNGKILLGFRQGNQVDALSPTKLRHHCRIPEKYQRQLISLFLSNMTLKIMQHVILFKELLYPSKMFASFFSASEVAVVLLSMT